MKIHHDTIRTSGKSSARFNAAQSYHFAHCHTSSRTRSNKPDAHCVVRCAFACRRALSSSSCAILSICRTTMQNFDARAAHDACSISGAGNVRTSCQTTTQRKDANGLRVCAIEAARADASFVQLAFVTYGLDMSATVRTYPDVCRIEEYGVVCWRDVIRCRWRLVCVRTRAVLLFVCLC